MKHKKVKSITTWLGLASIAITSTCGYLFANTLNNASSVSLISKKYNWHHETYQEETEYNDTNITMWMGIGWWVESEYTPYNPGYHEKTFDSTENSISSSFEIETTYVSNDRQYYNRLSFYLLISFDKDENTKQNLLSLAFKTNYDIYNGDVYPDSTDAYYDATLRTKYLDKETYETYLQPITNEINMFVQNWLNLLFSNQIEYPDDLNQDLYNQYLNNQTYTISNLKIDFSDGYNQEDGSAIYDNAPLNATYDVKYSYQDENDNLEVDETESESEFMELEPQAPSTTNNSINWTLILIPIVSGVVIIALITSLLVIRKKRKNKV